MVLEQFPGAPVSARDSYRDGDFAVIVGDRSEVAYFDLAADPYMNHNLLVTDPARAGSAMGLVEAARAWKVRPVTRSADASPETIEALQALGYVERDAPDIPAAPAPPP